MMDTTVIASLAIGIVAVVVAIVAVLRGGGTVAGKITDIQMAVGAAKEWVLAAEQLWKTGRLPADERAAWVLAKLKETFPGISEQTLKASIESAVAWMQLIGRRDE